MSALEDLRELIRTHLPAKSDAAKIACLRVAPDVWTTIEAAMPALPWPAVVDAWLPPGAVVFADASGRPLEKESEGR